MIRTEGMTQAAMDNPTDTGALLPVTPEDYALAETVVHASNIVSHDGYYEVDIDRAATAIARHRHQSGRTGAGERETVARVIHQCLRPVNMMNADWDSGAILGADNSWRRSVYSTADHILAALSQSTAGEDGT